MTRFAHWFPRRLISMIVLAILMLSPPIQALAQANSCSQLSNTLRQLERNREYRGLAQSTQTAQQLGPELQQLERAFTGAGCQRALNAGQSLSRECAQAARQIQRGRRDMATLDERIRSGQAVARQRDQILQQMQQQCGNNTRSNVTVENNQPRGFFEQLFDSLSGNNFGNELNNEIIIDPVPNYYGSTVRSVCVRTCDGYYWPVSFSTVPDYLSNDTMQCQQQANGADVELYYYSNPGQSPAEMVSMSGQPYSSLPNAFRYREVFDDSCRVQPDLNVGTIEFVDAAGDSRAVLNINERVVPLPLRDPRRSNETVFAEQAQTAIIPLPRHRPVLDGEGNPPPVSAPTANAEMRLVQSGGRTVRLVGPDTPYAQSTATDS